MEEKDLSRLEEQMGYTFCHRGYLLQAVTHSSYANEQKMGRLFQNERLEFLGDAVLELIISKYLYDTFAQMPEGELTKLRASVVCESSLAAKARELDLGAYLRLGKGEDATGGRNRESVLEDAFEAVIGAVYLDGGIAAAQTYVLRQMIPVVEAKKSSFRDIDYKTKLQEVIQRSSQVPLKYESIGEKGPDHQKEFMAQVLHSEKLLGQGVGHSKKEAEQQAAREALCRLSKGEEQP